VFDVPFVRSVATIHVSSLPFIAANPTAGIALPLTYFDRLIRGILLKGTLGPTCGPAYGRC
jgi:hypothetical protein